MLRRLAAVMVNLGVVSSAGVLRMGAAGVTDVLLLALAEGTVLGSTETAADRRDGGRDIGGVASFLPAVEGTRLILVGRAATGWGVDTEGGGLIGLLRLSFKGILMVPALGAVGTGAGTAAGVGVDAVADAATAGTAAASVDAIGVALGNVFCFFFCCVSGSMDGDAEVTSSSLRFFEAFFSVFGASDNVGVVILLIRSNAFVTASGLNRFFRLEVIAPS